MTRVLRASGFWRRAAAFGVDALWLFCLVGSLSWVLFGSSRFIDWSDTAELGAWLLRDVLPAGVFIVGWWLFGATPGKVLLELRVVDVRTGGRSGLGRSVVRYIGYFLSALPLGLGFLWMLWDRHNQTLHDKLARTRVVVVEESILATPTARRREAPR